MILGCIMKVYMDRSNVKKEEKKGFVKSDKEIFPRPKVKDIRDELLPAVIEFINGKETISISRIQTEFSIGYIRARKIMHQLIEDGLVDSRVEYVVVNDSEDDV